MEEKVLTVIDETEILGKRIQMYGSVDNPLFLAKAVAEWIDYSKRSNGTYQTSNMLKHVDEEEKAVKSFNTLGGVQESWFLTEDGLYECCMRSTKPVAKEMKKEIKHYLKSIRLTGAAIPQGREEEMVEYYFSGLSSDLQGKIVNELMEKNKELQQFYDDLINTEGVMSINTCAKELGIGEYKLFSFLRGKKVFFYNKDMVNIPYERFRKEGKFVVKETQCHDGNYRAVTYVTKKGLAYIRKLLRKNGYYEDTITV